MAQFTRFNGQCLALIMAKMFEKHLTRQSFPQMVFIFKMEVMK